MTTRTPTRPPLLDSVLDKLGSEIVSGQLAPGQTFTLHDICQRFTISRTVARETMRALEHLNLVSSSRRIGLTVQPPSAWKVFDSNVIRWRLECPSERTDQLASLTSLREAVEPIAARSMALSGTPAERARLRELAATLRRLGHEGRGATPEFLEADVEFHTLMLTASRNEMFGALATTIAAVLTGRTDLGLQPEYPNDEAMDMHEALADAILHSDPAEAERQSRALVSEVGAALALNED
ncbi:FadR/GntR family transcriptional regulator [Corynebacterium pygosceleis]|uniref:FCD domain-containing protein n=1 Tax=Corynebacterium pygosceleis TaxID=2800406 RepID=A0A9Q4GJD4_9CORY|nr:FCD domain-containing protein [Corynebacterium pygosceleis]MCK7638549.1 FCD domain-containing protein [Corynebacterium pygosceleis]MCK7676327.1 FCD domain-containing protein [Corynebacterium pygosceleis]MCL0121514.1 FCD domain-containing protein [Corynebacterium pygosceleis]MCX7445737.1 FCD domain-containing protein [Corynebacterium pygosceleis]MCX7469308.1 FCD domain-containing protein [Corynebacterium pygosceleis]